MMKMKNLLKTTAVSMAVCMMVPLTAAAQGGNVGGGGTVPGQGTSSSNYESYCVTIDDTGDTTGLIKGSDGDHSWLASGTYNVNVELTSDGKQIHYWYTNNGKTTQSGYLNISLAEGYSATAIRSIENQGTNSQAESFDNSDVHITLVTIKNEDGEEVPAYANGIINVYIEGDDGSLTFYNSTNLFTNVLVDGKSTYYVTPENFVPEGYEFVRTEGDALSGVIDGDKSIDIIIKEKVETKKVDIIYVDESGNVIKDSETVHTGNKNSTYDVNDKISIPEGYELVRVDGDSVSGTLDTDKLVTVVLKQKTYLVQVKLTYQDEPDKNKYVDSFTGKHGETYSVDADDYVPDGYELIEVKGDPVSGTLTSNKNIEIVVRRLNTSTVTVNFVDESGNTIATPETISETYGINGWTYEVDPKDYGITGYTYKNVREDSGKLTDTLYEDTDVSITLVYTQDMCSANVKVNFIDKSTGEVLINPYTATHTWAVVPRDYTQIKPSYVFSNNFANNTTTIGISANGTCRYSFEGYYLVETDATNFTPEDGGNYEFTYYLDRVEYNAKLTINFVDIFGNTIADSVITNEAFKYGEKWSYEVDPEDCEIAGYKYKDHDGNLADSTEVSNEFEVTLIYVPMYNVEITINYIDSTTGESIKESDHPANVLAYEENFKIDIFTPEILKYKFVNSEGELNYDFSVVEDFSATVNMYYEPITQFVRVIDVDGNVIEDYNANYISTDDYYKDAESVEDLVYDTVLDGKIPEGYTFDHFEGDNPEGILDSDKYVSIVVKKQKHTVTVEVVTEDGDLIDTDKITGDHGEDYKVDTDDYIPNGYELVEVKGEPEGKLDSDKEITIVVKKQKHVVDIEVVTEDGKLIDDDNFTGNHGDKYDVVVDEYIPDGYELVEVKGEPSGALDNDKEITIVVKKQKHTVTVEVKDEDGNVIDTDKITGDHGEGYKVDTDEYIPDGYELVEVKGETSGKLDRDKNVTIIVKKKVVEEPATSDDKTDNTKPEEPKKEVDNTVSTTTVKTGDTNSTIAVTVTTMLVALAAFVMAIRKRLIK